MSLHVPHTGSHKHWLWLQSHPSALEVAPRRRSGQRLLHWRFSLLERSLLGLHDLAAAAKGAARGLLGDLVDLGDLAPLALLGICCLLGQVLWSRGK